MGIEDRMVNGVPTCRICGAFSSSQVHESCIRLQTTQEMYQALQAERDALEARLTAAEAQSIRLGRALLESRQNARKAEERAEAAAAERDRLQVAVNSYVVQAQELRQAKEAADTARGHWRQAWEAADERVNALQDALQAAEAELDECARANTRCMKLKHQAEARAARLETALQHCVKTIREWPQLHADGDYLHGWVLHQAEAALAAASQGEQDA